MKKETLDDLTVADLDAFFDIDPATGAIKWKVRHGMGGRFPAGLDATTISGSGYRYVFLFGKRYRASRIIWLKVHGQWPKGQLDHKNRKPTEDRIENLRECTQFQNKANSGLYKNNTSGCPGVSYDPSKSKAKWRATVTKDGRVHHCGWHLTKEAAIAARIARARELHGDFAPEARD